MPTYKALKQQVFRQGDYTLVPIRAEDRYDIMRWRNEQMYHLRQPRPLTIADQERYFAEVVSALYAQSQPEQLLFSFLQKNRCIGYGGLVHINWSDQHAEISFIMDTELESKSFAKLWLEYLAMIEQVAFLELGFHRIFTYAFDLRPHLYSVLEEAGFHRDAVLRDHLFFEGRFVDVIIHSKLNNEPS